MVRLLDHDAFLEHETGQHVERPDRLRAIRSALTDLGLLGRVDRTTSEPAERSLLERVHAPDHVAEIEALSEAGGGRVDADTVASAGTYRAARLSSGAAVEAADAALDGTPAFSLGRPPGHHATADQAMGFCFFNHAAVAATWALEAGCDRVAVVDHDVHHGNGTQDLFYESDEVLYASIHQSPLYPGTGDVNEAGAGPGEGYTVNLPMPPSVADGGYLRALDEVVLPAIDAYDPALLLVSAGIDTHHRDPLGGFHLSSACFADVARRVLDVGAPTAFLLEGGYDLQGLARGVASQVAVLAEADVPAWDEDPPPGKDPEGSIQRAREVHADRWPVG